MALLFIIRGALFLSVFPPFEGWDEYQHIAYVQFLIENGRPPVLGADDDVPRSLYPALVLYPQSALAVEQLRGLGTLDYSDYWASESRPALRHPAPRLPLYQAQHAPLYYRLVAPLFRMLWRPERALTAITALRWVNILFGAAAVYVAGFAIGRLVVDGAHRYLIVLLVALQPLFLANCARIANDALGVLLATIGVALLLLPVSRRGIATGVGAGAACGLAVLAKVVNLTVLPLAVFSWTASTWSRRIPLRRAAIALGLFLVVVACLTAPYFLFNLKHFGLLTPVQEAVMNQMSGKSLSEYAQAASHVHWVQEIQRRFARHALWRAGWSFLRPPRTLERCHQWLVWVSMLGWCLAWYRSRFRDRLLFLDSGTVWRIVVLFLSVVAGMAYHMLQGVVAIGSVYTNIWYAAFVFPWLICLFYQGVAYLPGRWTAPLLGTGMLVAYLAAELYGILFLMVRAYTGQDWSRSAWNRLAELHLRGMGPEATFPAVGLMLLVVAVALGVWIRAVRLESRWLRAGLDEASPPTS